VLGGELQRRGRVRADERARFLEQLGLFESRIELEPRRAIGGGGGQLKLGQGIDGDRRDRRLPDDGGRSRGRSGNRGGRVVLAGYGVDREAAGAADGGDQRAFDEQRRPHRRDRQRRRLRYADG
jgi:hypothetical protein